MCTGQKGSPGMFCFVSLRNCQWCALSGGSNTPEGAGGGGGTMLAGFDGLNRYGGGGGGSITVLSIETLSS